MLPHMSKVKYSASSFLLLACVSGRLALAQSLPAAPPTETDLNHEWQSGVQLHSATPPPSAAYPARPVIPEPFFLLHSRIIISGGILSDMNPKDIAKVDVYKGMNVPVALRGVADRGVMDITLKTKTKLTTKSLADISRWLELTGPVDFQLQGKPLLASELRIATEGIAGLDVTRAVTGTVVNIRLTPLKPTPPGKYPPGTIFIRGLAGR